MIQTVRLAPYFELGLPPTDGLHPDFIGKTVFDLAQRHGEQMRQESLYRLASNAESIDIAIENSRHMKFLAKAGSVLPFMIVEGTTPYGVASILHDVNVVQPRYPLHGALPPTSVLHRMGLTETALPINRNINVTYFMAGKSERALSVASTVLDELLHVASLNFADPNIDVWALVPPKSAKEEIYGHNGFVNLDTARYYEFEGNLWSRKMSLMLKRK